MTLLFKCILRKAAKKLGMAIKQSIKNFRQAGVLKHLFQNKADWRRNAKHCNENLTKFLGTLNLILYLRLRSLDLISQCDGQIYRFSRLG